MNVNVSSIKESWNDVSKLIQLNAHNQLDERAMMRLLVACEEVFINICSYAYIEAPGKVEIQIVKSPFSVTFIDEGIEFNPLQQDNPHINFSPEERRIGGLGILIVKRYMKQMIYKRKNGKNILTLFP